MKKCPQCGRDYTDDTLSFCLDDGASLLDGPASMDGPRTEMLPDPVAGVEAQTRTFESPQSTDETKLFTGPTPLAPAKARSPKKTIFAAVAGVLVVAAVAAGIFWKFGSGNTRKIQAIAVMPFANASENAESEYLADGLTDALIGALSKLPDLSVRSRTSAFRYKGKEIDTKKAGAELGVQALLSGRVSQHGDDLDLSLELIDTSTDSVIWSERYSRKMTDVASLQSEIAVDVAKQLKSTIEGKGGNLLASNPTENSEAYLLYLRGRFHSGKFTREGLQTGLQYFNEAIEKDPEFASAYAGISYYYIISADWFIPSREALGKAKEAAEKALSIDPNNAVAEGSLAMVRWWYDWDVPAAEATFRKAVELDPNSSTTRGYFGWFLISTNRTDGGLEQLRKALELDPLSVETNSAYGQDLYFAHRYDLAEAQLKKVIGIDKSYWLAHVFLARTLDQADKKQEALKEARMALQLEDEVVEVRTTLARLLARSGDKEGARKILAELDERAKTKFVPAYNIAEVYVGLGENDKALDYLEKAYEERSFFMALLRTDPVFDGLRSNPRFKAIQEKTGL
jgi:TolB-like protein/Flp pilus assembly protein TadD